MPPRDPVQLTPKKFKKLKDELDELITIGRKLLADKLADYRSDDRSDDNAAYSSVLEEKRWMEQRIKELEETLENAEIATPACDMDKISLGCKVKLKRNGGTSTFTLVPSLDANTLEGKISVESPMGKALLGKKVGDEVIVNTPEAKCSCKVLKIGVAEEE